MGVRISALPVVGTPALSDVFPIVQGGVTYKESITQLAALLGTSGGLVTPDEVQESAFNFKAATGTNDAFVVNLSPAPAAYTDGLLVTMASGSLHNTTTSPTLKVNSLAAKDIVTYWGNPLPGDIATNGTYIFIYNAADDNFQLINPTLSSANTQLVQYNSYNTGDDSGTANAYAVTLVPAVDAINNSLQVNCIIAHTNTGASTLTVNGLTKNIVTSANAALVGGELVAGQNAFFIYSGTYDAFILINSALAATVGGITVIHTDSGDVTPSSGAVTISGGTSGLTTSGTSSTLDLTGTLAIGHGGTGVTSVTIAPTASAWAGWDVNKNFSGNNFIPGWQTIATAAATTTLTVASPYITQFTGSTTQTSVMPVVSTLVTGQEYLIINSSSDNVTIQSSGGNTIIILNSNTSALLVCQSTSGTGASSWQVVSYSSTTGAVSTVQGTANQVLVNGVAGVPVSGNITLTLPQDIATSSSPTFAGATLGDINLTADTISTLTVGTTLSIIPNTKKTVFGTGTAFQNNQGIYANTTGSLGAIVGAATWVNGATSPSHMSMLFSRGAAVSTHGAVQSGDLIGQVEFVADDGTNYLLASKIRSTVTQAVSTGIIPTSLSMYTTNTSGTNTLGFTLDEAQVVTLANPLPVGSGGLGVTTTPSNGQIPIGNGTKYTVANITAGSGISITNGVGSITIDATGSGSGTVNSGTAQQVAYYATTGDAVSGLTVSNNSALIADGSGNLASLGFTTTATASKLVERDSNVNIFANNVIKNQASISAGGSTTLTAASAQTQLVSGTGASTIVLPDATTLALGWPFYINNNATGNVTVKANDGSTTVLLLQPAQYAQVYNTSISTSNGTWDFHWLVPTNMANGQVLIGGGANGPKNATLTQGTGISITNGSNSITIAAASGVATTYTADSGSATPSSNSLAVVGASGITTSGSGATLTITAGASIPNSFATDSGTATPVGNSLSIVGGTGISTSGSGSTVTITATGGGTGLTWSTIAGTTQTAAVNHGYVIGNASQTTVTLPTTAAVGDIVAIAGQGTGGWVLAPGSGQTIKVIGSSAGTSLTSAERYDAIEVVCIVANTTWLARSVMSTGLTIV